MTERKTWYFTFGGAQVHPRTNAPLNRCYTTAFGTVDEVRRRVIDVFGKNWSFQYADADGPSGAGVEQYNLRYVPCVDYSPGELLPPTPRELECGEWSLETYSYTDAYESYFTVPYHPQITELTYMLHKYNIPNSATIEYGECGSHTIIISWDTVQ